MGNPEERRELPESSEFSAKIEATKQKTSEQFSISRSIHIKNTISNLQKAAGAKSVSGARIPSLNSIRECLVDSRTFLKGLLARLNLSFRLTRSALLIQIKERLLGGTRMSDVCTVSFDGGYIPQSQPETTHKIHKDPDKMYHPMGYLLYDQENNTNQHHNNQKLCD